MGQLTQFANSGFIAKVNDGDELPIGGSNMFNTASGAKTLSIDYSSDVLAPLLEKMNRNFKPQNLKIYEDWLSADPARTSADIQRMASLCVMQHILKIGAWQKGMQNRNTRMALYDSGNARLSDVYKHEQLACSEFSALTSRALETQGHSVQMISGSFVDQEVAQGDFAYSDPHAYLAIDVPEHNEVWIYDPSNPLTTQNGEHLPSVFRVSKTEFEIWLTAAVKKSSAYLKLKQEFTGKTLYYGASLPNTSFNPELHITNI